MQQNQVAELHDLEVARLIRYIRQEEDSEHIAQLCAEVASESARIARHIAKVGFSLKDEWKSADHMMLVVREPGIRVAAIHIRATGNHDNQGVNVSHAMGRRPESEAVAFSLPREFHAAKDHILSELFNVFPAERLIALKTRAEVVPLFEPVVEVLPPPKDESELKERESLLASGEGKMIKSPYAEDNHPRRSFSNKAPCLSRR